MRVGIRVDASPIMGTGHLRRCLSLAQALRRQGDKLCFVSRALGVDSRKLIQQQDFRHAIILPHGKGALPDPMIPHSEWAEVELAEDIDQSIAALEAFAPDWVVVDSYSFDARWHDAIRRGLACKIAQIDDVADRTIAPDMLIDHNYVDDHCAKYAGRLRGQPVVLGGPQFALLGPSFESARRYSFVHEVRSIGVFMGGVDIGNYSATVLDALDQAGFDGPVEIVTTSANPNLELLRAKAVHRAKTHICVDLPNLADFFARHDLQVGAGGGASWERCCVGVPTLLVVIAANQQAVAPQLACQGIVALAARPTRNEIADQLAELLRNPDKRRELSIRSRQLVDGRGASRVAKEMKCRV